MRIPALLRQGQTGAERNGLKRIALHCIAAMSNVEFAGGMADVVLSRVGLLSNGRAEE